MYKIDCGAASEVVETLVLSNKGENSATGTAFAGKGATVVRVPVMGESITTGILAKWISKVGEIVSLDQVIGSIETDKVCAIGFGFAVFIVLVLFQVTVDVRSPMNGKLSKVYALEGQEVSVDENLFEIVEQEGVVQKLSSVKVVAEKVAEMQSERKVVKNSVPVQVEHLPSVNTTVHRSETRVKMTRMRQRIAQRLKDSQNTAAMLTTFQEVDMTNLIELRNKYKEDFEKIHGVKLGFMSAFVRVSVSFFLLSCLILSKACASSLTEIPAVNAVIDDATNEIIYRNYIDISVAVASPTGLVVPVLRNTEKMSFAVSVFRFHFFCLV